MRNWTLSILLWQLFIEAYKNRDFERASRLILLNPEIMENGLYVIYDALPEALKFSLPLECYTQHGDRMPAELLEKPRIEIYRAGEEPIELAQNRISWTTDPDVARWFYDRNRLFGKTCHLYKAQIKPRNIIWHTDARQKKEVVQDRSVKNVVELPR